VKLLLILFIIYFPLAANEMKRIEAIVGDIRELREEYADCQADSKIYEMQLQEQRDKNKILQQELNSFKSLYKIEIDYKNEINKLKNQIKEQDNILKTKESTIKYLNSEDIEKNKTKEKYTKNLFLVKCDEANPFPELLMKKAFRNKKEIINSEEIKTFKASTFRLNKNAEIYNDVNGKVVDKWSEGTSFTSSVKTQNWLKITGYFHNKVWMKSSKSIWIKLSDVIKR